MPLRESHVFLLLNMKRGRSQSFASAGGFGRSASTLERAATVVLKRARINPMKRRIPQRRVEMKFYDTAYATVGIPSPSDASGGMADPSATSMLSTVAVGDTRTNRDGGQIWIHGVEIRGTVVKNSSEGAVDPPDGTSVYVALVLDKQTNGAQMSSENCFSNLQGTAATATSVMRNLDFRNRFIVLKQQWFDCSVKTLASVALNTFAAAGLTHEFQWYLRFKKPIKVNFNSVTPTVATIASVVDNCLHCIAYANTGGHSLGYNARIRFTD